MKYTLVTALMTAAAVQLASGSTTVTATNGTFTGPIQQVIDNAGNPVTGGTYQVGTFTDTAGLGSVAAANALDNFVPFGTAVNFSTNVAVPGLFGILDSGGVTADLPNTGDAPGPLIGQNIFAVVSDGSEFIIWDSGVQFAFEDPSLDIGPPVGFNVASLPPAALLRGVVVSSGNNGLGGPAANFNGQDAVTFIPEPSTSLLAGLAGLALLIRRKR